MRRVWTGQVTQGGARGGLVQTPGGSGVGGGLFSVSLGYVLTPPVPGFLPPSRGQDNDTSLPLL